MRPIEAPALGRGGGMQGQIVQQLGKTVARLFGPARRSDKAVRSRRLSSRRRRGPKTAASETEFLDQLKLIIRQNCGTAQAGRVNIIGLERLKATLGDRWSELRDRVHAVTRSAIQKYLEPNDVWVASGDKFVIAFGSLNFAEAQTKCRMIVRLIETGLLGDACAETISVATAATTLQGEVIFRDLPSLEAMIASAPTFFAGAPRHDRETLSGMSAAIARRAEPSSAHAVAQAEKQAAAPCDSVEAIELADDEPVRGQVVWEPVWDARTRRITIYRARYVDDAARESATKTLAEEDIGKVDFAVRDAVIDQLERRVTETRLAAIALPVRFWTVASWSRRRDYLAGLEKVSPERRQLLLIILSDLPFGVPPTRLVELVAALRPLCRELIVEAGLHGADIPAIAAARAFGVGTDLHSNEVAEQLLIAKLDQFARNAVRAGIANACLAGVHTIPQVAAAIGAGFRYISGGAIGPLEAEISGARPLDIDEIYRTNIEAKGFTWPWLCAQGGRRRARSEPAIASLSRIPSEADARTV
ncbi:MAG TPA: hypothetical protein VN728_16275 [Stellaceae bacterium]|nr:hypothetical protein [Stellaceae bacterium]